MKINDNYDFFNKISQSNFIAKKRQMTSFAGQWSKFYQSLVDGTNFFVLPLAFAIIILKIFLILKRLQIKLNPIKMLPSSCYL
jgi:hypothetical protein